MIALLTCGELIAQFPDRLLEIRWSLVFGWTWVLETGRDIIGSGLGVAECRSRLTRPCPAMSESGSTPVTLRLSLLTSESM